MFYDASAFNQDLCMWGQSISSGVTNLGDMFAETSCENGIATTPDLSTTPPGPFCYMCVTPSSQPSLPPSGMPSAEPSFTQVAFSTTTELKNQARKPFDDRDKKYGYAKMMTYKCACRENKEHIGG
jgi:hypothetical protein